MKTSERSRGEPLDPSVLEAVKLFVQVLTATGVHPDALTEAVAEAGCKVPRRWHTQARRQSREVTDAAHVLTLWFSDRAYLTARGEPIKLPLQGDGPSLSALVTRANPALKPGEVLKYLLRVHAIRRVGLHYLPKDRALSLRGSRGPTRFRNLRPLVRLLRTLLHNCRPKSEAPSWFEYFAENRKFPVRCREEFYDTVNQRAMQTLHGFDAEMHRAELSCREGEPTIGIGVGIYLFEDEGTPAMLAKHPRRPVRR